MHRSFGPARYVKPPIFTLAVGNTWGEAALLLAAGAKGNRSALPSATIMIKQVRINPVNLSHLLPHSSGRFLNGVWIFWVLGFWGQPIARFRGQATDIDIARKETRNVKGELVGAGKGLGDGILHGQVMPIFCARIVPFAHFEF